MDPLECYVNGKMERDYLVILFHAPFLHHLIILR